MTNIEKLKELMAKAAPGKWVACTVDKLSAASDAGRPFAYWTNAGPRPVTVGRSQCICADDMRLIAAMHGLLPALIAVVESARFLRQAHANMDGSFYTKQVYEGAQLEVDKRIAELEGVKL